ncbi:hypothetical protein J437_LFUL002660 [Ladona fulva]|uniref:Superoxide dismutase [Cu-Zn] n=1 Tax=Ladona fulva TaxID=123851 RepID=A0A8K0JY17_LADFU|nr:hypothetical protein J437_LFUL002660 [Ladona fulva]
MAAAIKIAVFLCLFVSLTTAEEIRACVVLDGAVVHGNLTFVQHNEGGPVSVTGEITGLSPGLHGMHVHEKGDLSGGCGSTGGHFNPEMKNHGSPTSSDRHVGDLGNIQANSIGLAKVAIVDSVISLLPNSKNNIVGRAIVVHAGEDDLGLGGHEDSLSSGHAGARLACGIIGIQSPTTHLASQASTAAPHYLGLTLIIVYISYLSM